MKFTPHYIRKKLKEMTSPENVDVTDVSKLKDGLSGKIWQKGGMLKPEVREKMLKLASEFYNFLGLDYPIKDIYFTGSLANYNWTSHSDADIHVIFDTLDKEEDELLSDYIFAKKDLWSDKHNITLYGFPVELFAKNSEDDRDAKAIFSLKDNQWIKKPSKKNVQIDAEKIKEKAAILMNKIDDIEQIKDNEVKYTESEKLKEKISKMRAAGLEQGGEYSTENLVFKTLRNNGYLQKLSNIKTSSYDEKMSLNENRNISIPVQKESKKAPVKLGVLMLNFDIPSWEKIINKIRPEDVYEIEKEPHVTVLYGFHDEVTPEEVQEVTKKVTNKPIQVKITGIDIFESDTQPYDVVKFDVSSKELTKMNNRLQKLPSTSTFKDYHPHMTIAKVKKGEGKKYAKAFKDALWLTGDQMVFSDINKKKTTWSLTKKNVLKVHKGIPGMTNEKIQILKDFVNFTCAKLQIHDGVTVVIRKGRDEYITTTASYLPSENENHIRAGGRAIVDICRSIGHELTHNRQRELGLFKAGEDVQNIGGKIEDEANSIAGILIKDFTHNYGFDSIYEL